MYSKVPGRTMLATFAFVSVVSAGIARASVVPDGTDFWFTSSAPLVSFRNGIRLITPGSIMSMDGSVLSNQSLLSKFQPAFNFIPLLNDKGLDALAVTGSSRRKLYLFSTRVGFYSDALHRYISDGDLLNSQGQIVATQADLLAALQPKNPNLDYGLATAYVAPDAGQNGSPDIMFSTQRSFYSNTLKRTINPGDVVSNTGDLVVTLNDLIKNFAPLGNTSALGLDSFSVLYDSSGKVTDYLFSTTQRFYSTALKQWIDTNDLLDSNGTIAMTQADMLKNYGIVTTVCGKPPELHGTTFFIPSSSPAPRPVPTPEPATMSLLAFGVLSLIRRSWS